MPDLIQVADDLKQMPDAWLAMQAQNPSGVVPPYLVVAELQRRQKLRSGAGRAQAPASSVSQDLIRSLQARMPPAQGLPPGSVPPTFAPPGMPPPNLSGNGGGGLGPDAPGTPPANMRMPVRMATGSTLRNRTELEDDDPWDDGEEDDDQDYTPLPAAAGPPVSTLRPYTGDPRFAPLAPLPPGSAGKDAYGRLLPVEAPPSYRDMSPVIQEQQQWQTKANEPITSVTDPKRTEEYRAFLEKLYGGQPDTKDLEDQATELKRQAQETKPTFGRMLQRWGMNLAASRNPRFLEALGESNLQAGNWADQQKQIARGLELARLRTQAEIAQRKAVFKTKVAGDITHLLEQASRQDITLRTNAQRRADTLSGQIDRVAAAKQAQDAQWLRRVGTAYVQAAKNHMTKELAIAGYDDPDPAIRIPSRQFIESDQSIKTAEGQKKKQEDYADFAKKEALRLENAKKRADYQHSLNAGPGKLTDAASRAIAADKVNEQLALMPIDDKGRLLVAATDAQGNLMFDPKTGKVLPDPHNIVAQDARGKDITTPEQMWALATQRAARNVRDYNNYTDDPVLKDDRNRQVVAGHAANLPYRYPNVKKDLPKKTLPIGIGQGAPPQMGTAGTRVAPPVQPVPQIAPPQPPQQVAPPPPPPPRPVAPPSAAGTAGTRPAPAPPPPPQQGQPMAAPSAAYRLESGQIFWGDDGNIWRSVNGVPQWVGHRPKNKALM